MKKIISSRSALVLCSYSSILFFAFSLISLGFVMFGQAQEKWIGVLHFGFFLGLACLFVWYLNRAACVIWVEDGIVKCKGLICGFYKECPVRSIQIVKAKYQREVGFGTFVYLVNDRTQEFKKFLRIRKDSYICFRKNKKNLAFLRTFWAGTIEE